MPFLQLMKKINSFFFILLAFYSFSQTYTTGTVNLSNTAGLVMTAKLDISTNVTLTFTGPSTRWFALGFNASSMAIGTDVVGVHSAGALTNFDANLTGYSAPATDAQQNWTITSDQVAAGVRTIIATRALNTGDANDFTFTAAPGNLSLIWARGSSNTFIYAYHGNTNRGITNAILTLVPVTPAPTGSANQSFCSGSTLSQVQVVGSNVQWYATPTGGIPLANNSPLVNGTTYYASQTIGGVESQNRLAVTITLLTAPSGIPVFNGTPSAVCSNVNSLQFTINAIANATTYSWTSQATTVTTSQPNTTFPILPGMNSITVTVNGVNACGQGPSSSITVGVNPAYNSTQTATSCDSFVWNNQVLVASGNYIYQGTTVSGCDSIVNLQLTILNNSATNLIIGQCSPLTLNGQTYVQSGIYQQTLPSVLGCDSVLNIQFTLFPSDTTVIPLVACDSVIIGGQVFINTGMVSQNLTSVHGCDSVVLWNVIINSSSLFNLVDTTVESAYVWNGQTYTESGTYTQTFFTSEGCDSVVTLDLTVFIEGLSENENPVLYPTLLRHGEEISLPMGTWELIDLNGRVLWTRKPDEETLILTVPSGIYLIRNNTLTFKIQVID